MSKQNRVKYIIFILVILPFVLNIFRSGTGWLYWLAWLLLGVEQFIAGTLLIFFPMALQRLFGTQTDRRVAILLIILGFYFLIIGFDNLSLLSKRWFAECSIITQCLK